ncbi:MAG: DegT/DnrJ/EryC1/StrS family aminotransferase [Desulfovibrionaceae bacterium]
MQRLPELSSVFATDNVLLTSNGTTALWLALQMSKVEGKAVLLPANVCFVVVCAVLLCNARPVFVDVDERTWTIPLATLQALDKEKIHAVILPYMYGCSAPVAEIAAVCRSKGWIFIEDVAQALGARWRGGFLGSVGDFAITSFGVGKIVDLGLGGALAVRSRGDAETAETLYTSLPLEDSERQTKLRTLVMGKYVQVMKDLENLDGVAYTCEEIVLARDYFLKRNEGGGVDRKQLSTELRRLEELNTMRRGNAEKIQTILSDKNGVLPLVHPDGSTYWRQNVLVSTGRNTLLRAFRDASIKSTVYFPPVNKMFYDYRKLSYPIADNFFKRVINLWTGVETDDDEVFRIEKVVRGLVVYE